MKDLKKTLWVYSNPQHKPSVVCTGATPSTLLYVDEAKEPRDIYWLDLSDGKPKPAARKRVIHTRQSYIMDMCFTRDGDRHLVVVVDHTQGIFAFNADTGELEWTVCGKLPGMEKYPNACGVTTDGRGHLFVADCDNKCIYMFSVSDGQYLGCLINDLKYLSGPGRLDWCEATSSLICSCRTDLKVINIEY